MIQPATVKRWQLRVNGIVQGVGFRPFIYNLAKRLDLTGFVGNDSSGVIIESQGDQEALQTFIRLIREQPPPLARITDLQQREISVVRKEANFIIQASDKDSDNRTLISPDTAICGDCLRELFNAADRRYLYPFINCTNCGPRFTIIRAIPYDRPATTMAPFTMCPACQAEYDDPANRRFHAQPNACPECGPQIWYESDSGQNFAGRSAIEKAATDLLQGKIVAIKGLGGFHLACDARNEKAVARLRLRKNREEKPLAIMVSSVEKTAELAEIPAGSTELLSSYTRPILLLPKRSSAGIAPNVAPGNRRLGIMLPYAPLHYVLFHLLKERAPDQPFPVLVMTSANLSEEPIAIANDEARQRLDKIADAYLMHDRDILIRADDSVLLPLDSGRFFFRRSRGYVPQPVFLRKPGIPVLAAGGELKNTICILKEDRAFVSQHIGDMENLAAHGFFEETADHLQKVLEIRPKVIAADLHPGYFSTRWALETSDKVIRVQHHHAHLASCLAEHQHDGPAIGIILDGTGYGYDGRIWGGEILIGDFTNLRRYAHLEYLPLPGGDAAIREPWRIAAGYLQALLGEDFPDLKCFAGRPVEVIRQMIRKNINCVQTSSCGRLFDAVAAMAGGKAVIRYEAQAAIELTQAAERKTMPPFDYDLSTPAIPLFPLIASILKALNKGENFSIIATRFHATLVELFTRIAIKAAGESGIKTVALGGGVFQNEILLQDLMTALQKAGFTTLVPLQMPANDGGLSLGQAVIARELQAKGLTEVKFEN